ncbi:MAG TPA: proton-conducting transporter membrane subunit, partial [Tepidisphaeraceae bacterium]|nr:proton-conducting transporter membrane subunit [Tepidisphaeraceae bacterium]
MPSPAIFLIIATFLPMAAAIVLFFFGRRIGNPLGGILSTVFITASFVCAMIAMTQWLSAGAEVGSPWGAGKMPIYESYRWIPIGVGTAQEHAGFIDASIYVDSLTIAMFSTITLVAMLVHIFSIRYMRGDMRFGRYFCYLSLFCFSMLALVLGGSVLQVFIFWELVGICSYLLIGFWYEKGEAADAAIKAFVVNRVGDIGFL